MDGTEDGGTEGGPAATDGQDAVGSGGNRWRRLARDRRVAIGAAVLAAVLLAGGLVLALGGGDDDPDADAAGSTTSSTLKSRPGDRDGDGVPDADDADPDDPTVGRRGRSTTTDPDSTGGTTAPGGSGTTTVPPTAPPFPEDPEQDVIDAYMSTFIGTCESVWARSPDGVLVDPYLPDATFTVDECTLYADEASAIGFLTIEDAELAAQTEAWDVASDLGTYGILCVRNTNNCWEWGEE